jgi:hypothetical protein
VIAAELEDFQRPKLSTASAKELLKFVTDVSSLNVQSDFMNCSWPYMFSQDIRHCLPVLNLIPIKQLSPRPCSVLLLTF